MTPSIHYVPAKRVFDFSTRDPDGWPRRRNDFLVASRLE
jgi:hypothetical protein